MSQTRRNFVLTGLGTMAVGLTGCAPQQVQYASRPAPSWPTYPGARAVAPPPVYRPTPVPAPPRVQPTPTPASPGTITPIARGNWTRQGPRVNLINPLGRASRITVHHEGASPVWFSDWGATVKRLEAIRKAHLRRGWADIGYHYVIDRGGRVWEARAARFQGAHVRNHNENNVGVMVLGNFNEQSPSDAQLLTLRSTLRALSQKHGVSVKRIYTHQELSPTGCPGRSLQRHMVWLRGRNLA